MARTKRNSSKVNLVVSFVFHSLLVVGMVFLAAKEGILGKKMKTIVAEMVKKEKPPEQPKEKPPDQKLEPPKPAEAPKTAAVAPPRVETASAPTPSDSAPAAAPAAVVIPDMDFTEGAKIVQTVSDPNLIYKGSVERSLRSRWNRPDNIADDQFVAEVELSIDPQGHVTGSRWLKGSGDPRWDNSVKAAVAATKTISTAPPKNFPGKFTARFDVEAGRSEEVLHVSQVNPR